MKEFNYESSADRKQHIGFSQYAYNILKEDYALFNPDGKPDSWNSFLNKIIENYQDLMLYPANISRQFDTIYEDYCKSLSSVSNLTPIQQKNIKKYFKNAFIKTYKGNLKFSYPDKLSKTFNLSDNVAERLADMEDSIESVIFERPGKYLSAIFESYAREPFLDREKIVLNEQFEKLERATKRNKCIRFIHTNGKTYKFIPYTLQPDKMGTYWYLAGVVFSDDNTRYYSSFRLSRIVQVRELANEHESLTYMEEQELNELILEKGIQFLVGHSTKAVVQFTPAGLKKYANVLHRRPQISSQLSSDTFEFVSTLEQLEYYFFSFGKDAKILEPSELRDIIATKHAEAAQIYT